MDSAAAPQVLASSPRRLDVGVRNGGLGWVEIRAHAAMGEVSAVLSTSSGEAHAAVSAQMPEMREYLGTQHVRVDLLPSEQLAGSSRDGPGSSGSEAEGRPGGHAGESSRGLARSASADDASEDSLSYINIRV
jgi:flagellar hook-length control protein FliK